MSARHRRALAAWGALLAIGCADPEAERVEVPEEAVGAAAEITFDSREDMEAELEVLGLEIAGLAEYLESRPDGGASGAGAGEPRALLEAARAARAAAADALTTSDTARAADSLRAAAVRIEHVKRLLAVAEEVGVEFEPPAEAATPAPD